MDQNQQEQEKMDQNQKPEKQRFEKKSQMAFYFLKGNIRYFVVAIIFASILALLEMVNPKVISYTVDTVIGDEESSLPGYVNKWIDSLGGISYLQNHIWIIAVFVIVVALLGVVCRYLFGVFNAKGAEGLVKKMRDSLYEHILHLPYKWHGENATGDIIQRCTSDVDTIKRFLSEQMTSLFRVVIMICLALFFMIRIHPVLSILPIVFIPTVVGYSLCFHNKLGAAFEKVDEEEGNLSAIAQENLTGVRVVRAFGRERYERDRFEKKNDEYTGMWVHMMKLLSLFWTSNDGISGIQLLLVLTLGANFCVNGEMTPGQYIAFISYNAMLIWPVRSLGRVISEMSKAGISISRIMYIMNASEEKDIIGAVKWPKKNDITFDHVSFQFDNGTNEVLRDVSLTIKEGTTVGILGGTGSGKSTLIHLLDRLYQLEEGQGEIRIGDVNINDMEAASLRENLGLVLQEPYLFSRTLGENIKIAAKEADMDDVKKAATLACLDHAIDKFTEKYETPVGERGVTLSGGQKQRTAIAQMMIRNPKVMIFDDSLSAVDSETDSKIRKAIAENTKGTTVILISHRITTIMQADQIFVLDKGSLKEQGTHEELLAKNGMYRKIYDLQRADIE